LLKNLLAGGSACPTLLELSNLEQTLSAFIPDNVDTSFLSAS
jgi:hypothetical protein